MSDTRKFKRKVKQSNPTNPSGAAISRTRHLMLTKKL